MMFKHHWGYNELYAEISDIIEHGDWKKIRKINYRRPVKVVSMQLRFDTVEIKTDDDIKQMIKRWKKHANLMEGFNEARHGIKLNCLWKLHTVVCQQL